MEVVKREAYGLVVALLHVDDDARSAFGAQLRLDVEQVLAHLHPLCYAAEHDAFVVAHPPKRPRAESHAASFLLHQRRQEPTQGHVAVVDVNLFAPSRYGR